ncbi:helix-turn-helix domain-containing protein [Paenibacillus motobuensis]|uniref:HTH psq-type domain-containing protein n=1 Tax=Paenibacillus motobuensis TaxID=295324 RepID=A0ABP3IEH9_9BACL
MIRYSDETRLKAALGVLENGMSDNQAARKYGMNHVTVIRLIDERLSRPLFQ